jgi:peptidoglycan hydrolase-like protein with peptidoglycan-binding domain
LRLRYLALFVCVAALVGFSSVAYGIPAAAKKKPTTSVKKKSPAKKSGSKLSAKSSKKKPVSTVRSTQKQPTPQRYVEIQQALADRGYFKGPIDGSWGAESTEALKRFQREQNLVEDGKIGSLSLIALGLGPKRASPPPNADKPTP